MDPTRALKSEKGSGSRLLLNAALNKKKECGYLFTYFKGPGSGSVSRIRIRIHKTIESGSETLLFTSGFSFSFFSSDVFSY